MVSFLFQYNIIKIKEVTKTTNWNCYISQFEPPCPFIFHLGPGKGNEGIFQFIYFAKPEKCDTSISESAKYPYKQ